MKSNVPKTIKILLDVPIKVVIDASTYCKDVKVSIIPKNGPRIEPIPIYIIELIE